MFWKNYLENKPRDGESIIYKDTDFIQIGSTQTSIVMTYYGVYNDTLNQLQILSNSPCKPSTNESIINCSDTALWCNLDEYLDTIKQLKKEQRLRNKKVKQVNTKQSIGE